MAATTVTNDDDMSKILLDVYNYVFYPELNQQLVDKNTPLAAELHLPDGKVEWNIHVYYNPALKLPGVPANSKSPVLPPAAFHSFFQNLDDAADDEKSKVDPFHIRDTDHRHGYKSTVPGKCGLCQQVVILAEYSKHYATDCKHKYVMCVLCEKLHGRGATCPMLLALNREDVTIASVKNTGNSDKQTEELKRAFVTGGIIPTSVVPIHTGSDTAVTTNTTNAPTIVTEAELLELKSTLLHIKSWMAVILTKVPQITNLFIDDNDGINEIKAMDDNRKNVQAFSIPTNGITRQGIVRRDLTSVGMFHIEFINDILEPRSVFWTAEQVLMYMKPPK